MGLFSKIGTFVRRFVFAWRYARDDHRLRWIMGEVDKEIARKAAIAKLTPEVPVVVDKLLPAARHDLHIADTRQPLYVKIESGEIIGSREADQILEESRRDFQIPAPSDKKAMKALVAHNSKFNQRNI